LPADFLTLSVAPPLFKSEIWAAIGDLLGRSLIWFFREVSLLESGTNQRYVGHCFSSKKKKRYGSINHKKIIRVKIIKFYSNPLIFLKL
jgi:hypothetical protein